MAKKQYKKPVAVPEKQNYVSPTETLWGKILIWFIIIAMSAAVVFSVIEIIKYFN